MGIIFNKLLGIFNSNFLQQISCITKWLHWIEFEFLFYYRAMYVIYNMNLPETNVYFTPTEQAL